MNMLLEALNKITDIDFGRLYSGVRNKIMNTVGVEKDGVPTNIWFAGLSNSRGSAVGKVNRTIEALKSGRLDPESKEYRDAVRTDIAMNALLDTGLISMDDRGRYTFPQSQTTDHTAKRKQLSELRTFLTRDFHTVKDGADSDKSFRVAAQAAISDQLSSIPEDQQRYAKMVSSITLSAYNLLVNLYKKRGPKDVARFRDTMNNMGFKESQDLMLLRELGLVTDKNLLNRGELSKFGAFIKAATPAQMMALNKDIAKVTKMSQHTRQLNLNAAGKGNGPEDEAHVPDDSQFADDMNDDEDRAINSRIRDIEGGTKSSSKNDRAGGYNRTYSDIFRQSFD